MSIVRMKHLQMIVPHDECRGLLKKLTKAGCLEIERNDEWMNDPELSGILRRRESDNKNSKEFNEVAQALDALEKYAGVKKGLFQPRQEVGLSTVADDAPDNKVLRDAAEINNAAKTLYSLSSEISRIEAQKIAYLPWKDVDIPLEFSSKGAFFIHFGTLPAILDFNQIKADIEKDGVAADLELVNTDKELHYFVLTTHAEDDASVLEALKGSGFSEVYFKGQHGTVADRIEACNSEIEDIQADQVSLQERIKSYSESFEALGRAYDYFAAQSQWDDITASLPGTVNTALLSGWMPEESMDTVAKIAEDCGCAYEFRDPEDGESVPTALKNGKFVAPFGQVTSMYGMPAYNSLIDPNPVVAISYFVFFGLMFSDAAYGLLLFLGCLFFLKKAKPDGNMKRFITMFMLCGISTFAWGAFFGSWFGDFVTVFTTKLGVPFTMPAVMDPLKDPIPMLIMSLALGVVHLYTGMILNIVRQAKRGEWLDIIFDELTWMIFIPCVVLAFLGLNFCLYIAAAMLVVVLLTGGRGNKGLGKITGGLGAIYNGATGNLSDILSYSRLMALAMSTGVIAQVMNTLGNMLGGIGGDHPSIVATIIGWILFMAVFCFGQVFNFAISILGAFVHSCRLQFVELFGRFYEGDGREFNPLLYKTKYVEIKEN